MKRERNFKYMLLSVLSVITALVIWWIVTDILKLTTPTTLPSPVRVMTTFFQKMYDINPDGATLPQHLLASLQVRSEERV